MNENKNIKSSVLEKIQTGKINMRPRSYFLLEVASLMFVAFLTLITSSLLISFIIFSLVSSGKLFLFGFGARGFLMFFSVFPWPMLIVEIALIVLLEWLIKKFKFGYRSSLSRLVFFILLVSIAIGTIIDISPLHNVLQRKAERRSLPIVGSFYRGIRRPPPGQEIFRGTVSDVGTSSFVLRQDYGETGTSTKEYVIILPPGTSRTTILTIGDMVFVAGRLMFDDTVHAYGFQKFLPSSVE
jgi:hypothetical protein